MSNETATKLLSGKGLFSSPHPHAEQVRSVFEDASHYLSSREVDIRFRVDTVWTFAASLNKQRMLDVGCGDGCISLQMLSATSKLTLMDVASSMLSMAAANIQKSLVTNVVLRNEDFAVASFGAEKFDLIIAVGVLAHVDSPDAFLDKLRGLLSPGGHLILEFTDVFHTVGRVGRVWSWFKEQLAPAKYRTNRLSARFVMQLCAQHRLEALSTFRYARVPVPGFARLVPHILEFKLVRGIFGNGTNRKNQRFGNEYICLLKAA